MIQLDCDGPIATISLSRTDARNAMPTDAWRALAAQAEALANSDARVVLLRSEVDGTFSAGADIQALGNFSEIADATEFRIAIRGGIDALAALPMPTIAVVDGGCFGAAVALVLACDLAVAGPSAKFAITPAKLGIGYPREDVARLKERVGHARAARMLLTGDILDAPTASAIGLITDVADDARAVSVAMAARIAANAPNAVRLLKRTLSDTTNAGLDDAFDAAFFASEFEEGYGAFQQKRRPDF